MNIEELWYTFWLIKAVVSSSVLWVVGLLGKRVLRIIPWNGVERRSTKNATVHSLGTLPAPRNCKAPKSKAAALDPGDMKRRIG